MTHQHESPPLPWSTEQLTMVCPAVVGNMPLTAVLDERGKLLAFGLVPNRNELHRIAYQLLAGLGQRLNEVGSVVFMADAARNIEDLPIEPNPGDLVMLARDGDSRAVDTVAVTFVTIMQTRQIVVDYRMHDGTARFEQPVELDRPTDSHITPVVLKAWSQAIETVIS